MQLPLINDLFIYVIIGIGIGMFPLFVGYSIHKINKGIVSFLFILCSSILVSYLYGIILGILITLSVMFISLSFLNRKNMVK